jgi:hypothetical protein
MPYFNTDEERAARVERMFEELHRTPKPLKPVTWVLLTEPPNTSPAPTPPPPAPPKARPPSALALVAAEIKFVRPHHA